MYAMPVILAPENRLKVSLVNYSPAKAEESTTKWLANRRESLHEGWRPFREPIDHHSIKKAIANHKHHTVTTTTTTQQLLHNLSSDRSHRLFKRSVGPVSSEEREVMRRMSLDVPLELVGSSNNLFARNMETMARTADKVRRSSDVSIFSKSKRLIYTRHPSSSYRNNLDRNERSTLSHLSGPSRKIQLFIKNRFVQLMPDGTVNGTQDDLSEYSEYYTLI